jgi:hypothetical protein
MCTTQSRTHALQICLCHSIYYKYQKYCADIFQERQKFCPLRYKRVSSAAAAIRSRMHSVYPQTLFLCTCVNVILNSKLKSLNLSLQFDLSD